MGSDMTDTEVLVDDPVTLVCKRHPNVETLLRCNQCEEPICLKCAVRTPVGYRCRDCIRAQQDKAYNMEPQDPWLAMGTSLGLAFVVAPVANLLFSLIPFLFLKLIVAVLAGGGAGSTLAQLIRRVVERRRGRRLGLYTLVGILLGSSAGGILAALFLPVPPFSLPLLLFVILALVTAWPVLK